MSTPTDIRPIPQVEIYPTSSRRLNGGVQHKYEFGNGYTASVVQHDYSYGGASGLWELAVMHNERFIYDSPITDDVLGHLSDADVANVLRDVAKLPARTA